jgi:hypothetical protein
MNWRTKLTALYVLQAHQPTWRGSFFGMLTTGLPFIFGLILQRPLDGMLGAILGMLLMLNDFKGDLRQRLQCQLIMLAALLFGSLVAIVIKTYSWKIEAFNFQLKEYSAEFFILLLVTTFFAGWAQGSGKLLEGAARNTALALIVVSQLPHIDLTLQLFLVGSAVLSLLARIADNALQPQSIDLSVTPINENFISAMNGSNAGLRYATVYSICIVSGLLLGLALNTSKAYWVAVTIMMTMRPDADLNFVRSLQRIVGTIIGVAIAALVVLYVHDVWLIAGIILLIGLALPHGFPMNYGLHCSLIALFVLLLYNLVTLQYGGDSNLLRERIYDVMMGCCIALVGNMLAFPRGKDNETTSKTTENSGHSGGE